MDVIEKAKDTLSDAGEFAAVLGGLVLGQLVVTFVPKTKIAIVDKILPGAINVVGAGIVATQFRSNNYAKVGSYGLGASGIANIIANFTAGSSSGSIAYKVNKTVTLPTPKLNGLGNMSDAASFLSGDEPSTLLAEVDLAA